MLTARPDLRGHVEELATRHLSRVDPMGIADDVESALRFVEINELNSRAGHRPGIGYVHPVDAAAEILDELLQPFLDDLQRHARLGMTAAAAEMAAGILYGLHRCRDAGSESMLEYSPDFADERAAEVVRQCRALAVDLPIDDLVDALTGWEPLFGHGRSTR
ncbi:MAG: hypothetical protein L0K86_20960 [Actinomycetia bacterium]|nr:hypothetical protein [Actinomycetes bacterium]